MKILLLLPLTLSVPTGAGICSDLLHSTLSKGVSYTFELFSDKLPLKQRIAKGFQSVGNRPIFYVRKNGNIDDDEYRTGLTSFADALETYEGQIPGERPIHAAYIDDAKTVSATDGPNRRTIVRIPYDAPAESLVDSLSIELLRIEIQSQLKGAIQLINDDLSIGDFANALERFLGSINEFPTEADRILRRVHSISFTKETRTKALIQNSGLFNVVLPASMDPWYPLHNITAALSEGLAKDLLQGRYGYRMRKGISSVVVNDESNTTSLKAFNDLVSVLQSYRQERDGETFLDHLGRIHLTEELELGELYFQSYDTENGERLFDLYMPTHGLSVSVLHRAHAWIDDIKKPPPPSRYMLPVPNQPPSQ